MQKRTHAVVQSFYNTMSTAPLSLCVKDCRRMLVAYSGGADSTALLVLLEAYCKEKEISLTAVHVHHGIRAGEADRDAAFCTGFCAARGIRCRIEYVDAPAYSGAHSVGLEEAARILRYEVLERIASEEEGTLIATAHSADDTLETVLFRLVRGSALDGLCGIPPVRDRIIRPLLFCTAEEIRDYCHFMELSYVTDSTNADTSYTRNYIRKEIVPRLREISPEPALAVSRMCELLRADADYLHTQAMSVLRDSAKETFLSVDRLLPLPDALFSRCVISLYENAAGSRRDLTAQHIRDVIRAVRAGGFLRISLPGDITAVIAGRLLTMEKGRAEIPEPNESFEVPLMFGDNLFPDYGFGIHMGHRNTGDLSASEEDWQNIYKLSIRTTIPFDTIKGKVFIRFRHAGDELRTGGMTHSVKKLLSAAKIPPADRPRLPIVCDDEGILWIPGLPVRDGKRYEESGRDISLTYFRL